MHEPDDVDDVERVERALTAALRDIVSEDAGRGASPAVEAALRAQVRALAVVRRRARRSLAALAAAAALVAALAIPAWRWRTGESARQSAQPRAAAPSSREASTAFMPLSYSGVPLTDGHIVRMEVPRSSLVSFGLMPPDSLDSLSSGTVLADVIVGDDGLARAVRFVSRSVRKEPQR